MASLLLFKLAQGQLFRLCHPHALKVVKLGGDTLSADVMFSVLGFYVLYVTTAIVLSVAMMIAGLDLESAIGAVYATLNLTGPGLGEVAVTFTTSGLPIEMVGRDRHASWAIGSLYFPDSVHAFLLA